MLTLSFIPVFQGIVDMFVLSRTAEEVDLMQPRRDTAINLYDYFSGTEGCS